MQVAAYHHRVPARPPVTTAFCLVLALDWCDGYWFRPCEGLLDVMMRQPMDVPRCSIGPYQSPMQAYLAACRYAYGPIPRDFAAGVPAVVGLEGLFTAPGSDQWMR